MIKIFFDATQYIIRCWFAKQCDYPALRLVFPFLVVATILAVARWHNVICNITTIQSHRNEVIFDKSLSISRSQSAVRTTIIPPIKAIAPLLLSEVTREQINARNPVLPSSFVFIWIILAPILVLLSALPGVSIVIFSIMLLYSFWIFGAISPLAFCHIQRVISFARRFVSGVSIEPIHGRCKRFVGVLLSPFYSARKMRLWIKCICRTFGGTFAGLTPSEKGCDFLAFSEVVMRGGEILTAFCATLKRKWEVDHSVFTLRCSPEECRRTAVKSVYSGSYSLADKSTNCTESCLHWQAIA